MVDVGTNQSRPFMRLVSFNVLADSYVRPEWYTDTDKALLGSGQRLPALKSLVASLAADVICLQEMESNCFDSLASFLKARNYGGCLMLKGQGKPDGCAVFYNTRTLAEPVMARFDYEDEGPGRKRSGHLVQIATFTLGGSVMGVANTHIKWDPTGTPFAERYATRQIQQLLAVLQKTSQVDNWIICGDFNVTPADPVLTLLTDAGFSSIQTPCAFPTCLVRGEKRAVDYVFWSHGLKVSMVGNPVLPDTMPDHDHPSDHCPVCVDVEPGP